MFPPARIKVQPCLAYTNCYTLLRNGVFTYVKNVLPVLLKSANALLQVPHRNFLPGSWGDSSSRGPKQANRSSETARNFLRSAFRLLGFFPQTEHLKTSFLHSIDTIIAIKTKYCSSGAILFSAIRSFTAQRPRACACIIPSCLLRVSIFCIKTSLKIMLC